ncbi:MAG: beta-ketoacyl-ACP synthase II [Xanthomonadales bacterium]|nr:3-oxoacyl-[acyl-carrier-protein] synthase 2 [Xanthomonadales bacterium]MCC6594146.1 beta-ketoacyl-ACP synthase II [Xanthomonadales bacterium]
MRSARRVVVTGLGIVSPIGSDIATAWDNLKAGRSGIGPITHFDCSAFATRFAGQVQGFNVSDWVAPKDARRMDPFIHYGIAAGTQAIRDAGFDPVPEELRTRFGVMMAAGIGGISTIEQTTLTWHQHGPRRVSPFFVPGTIINMVAGHLGINFGLRGPNLSIVTACTTGTHNIGVAARLIAYGDADLMLAGGAEHATTPTAVGGFSSSRALSERNHDPKAASRPWDRDRDGFVLSDGAGALVLEEYEHAKARGARIYAEVIGFGMSDDAYHMTAPPEDGSGAALSMRNALADAGIAPAEVQYVNAHATSTPLGDRGEIVAIQSAFGADAASLMISSTKSTTGHLLGAAGAVEAIFCVLALRDQVVPATINLDHPEEGIDLDLVPNTARDAKLDVVMSNSFGFGGTNGTLVLRRM